MRRRVEFDEDELENQLNRGALWAVTYGDVMSYLMIFFLLMFTFSYTKNGAPTVEAIEKAFGTKTEEAPAPSQAAEEPKPAPKAEPSLTEELNKKVKGIKQIAKIEVKEDAVRLSFESPVLFDTGSSALKKGALPGMKQLAETLKDIPNPIHIEGHTDNVPPGPHAKFKSNFELSSARAFSVLQFFIEQGVPPSRMSALGYGEYQPVASNDTAEGRAQNRRIELEIVRRKAVP